MAGLGDGAANQAPLLRSNKTTGLEVESSDPARHPRKW